jgi:hypothetical protein
MHAAIPGRVLLPCSVIHHTGGRWKARLTFKAYSCLAQYKLQLLLLLLQVVATTVEHAVPGFS